MCSVTREEADPQKVGQDLGVRAVLSGRLLQQDGALVIRPDLMDVTTGAQIWSDQFVVRRREDIFAVQDELSREISERLRLRLTKDDEQRLTKRETESADAYQFYLQGLYHWHKRNPDGNAHRDRIFQSRHRG